LRAIRVGAPAGVCIGGVTLWYSTVVVLGAGLWRELCPKGAPYMRVAMVYANTSNAVGRGAGLIAAAVMDAGHELDFYNTHYTPWDQTANAIVSSGYDLLLVSTMTMTFPDAVGLIASVKQRTSLPVLVGGLHATIHGARLLEEHPEIDYLCVGEGESFIREFVERLGDPELHDTANLVYRDGGTVKTNPPRAPEDLSKLPLFPWHLFPEESIIHGTDRFLYVNASRGCPFNCTYCCNVTQLSMYGKGYLRFRPVENVLSEIAFLREHYNKPRAFYFEDEMLFFNKEVAIELLRGLKEMGVIYGAMARVEALDQELVDVLAETGCRFLAVGVECGDEEFRREFLNRRMTNAQIAESIAMLKAAGIYTKTYNMIGYPVPNDAELTKATVEFTERIAPDAAQFTILYPFPGTKLHDFCVEHDLIDQDKVGSTRTYYEDSVLRGVTLAPVRDQLDSKFNPLSQQLKLRQRLSDGSLRSRYEIARAWLGLRRRELAKALR
jgi:anaerobic magnesium-protoporphyrin IX monomethyl ester cyclase